MSSVGLKSTSTEDKMSMYESMVEELVADEKSRYILDDLQLAAELGKTLLERNKELENLLRAHQRKCEDQKQEIEFLTKQNLALKEVNDTRMQIYESLDISIHDLEREKHQLIIENSFNKKHIKELNETLEKLEQRCEDATKQFEDVRHILEQERRRNERDGNVCNSSNSSNNTSINNDTNESVIKATIVNKESTMRHIGSASEPESDEQASTPTNPSKSFTTSGQMSITQTTPFMNYSQDFSSIQPIYSHDSESHDSGFKTGSSSSNCADHEELLRVITELEETKQQAHSAQMTISELEQQLSVLSHENSVLQNRIVQSNTIDEMKSVHEELSFLEEVRQGGQMCTRCLKSYDDRMTDNTSYIGTEGDDEDRSLMELLNETNTHSLPPVYRSAVTIKDDEDKSVDAEGNDISEESKTIQYNPYKELVAKYEALLEIQRNPRTKQPQQAQQPQPQSLHDELNSTDFSSLNTKYTSEDEKKSGPRHPDFSEVESSSSGFSDEISSSKATQTDNSSFLFTIVDGEDCKFSIYDEAASAPIESRFRERPKYRELFKEIFTVLKKAAENKEEGESLPLLDDNEKVAESEASKVPPVTPATENIPPCKDFDMQSIISSAISENSIAISECITKTERKKAKSYKKQAAKEEIENKPPASAVQVIGGKLVTPYNRIALDFAAINAKKRARRSRQRSKDKYGTSGRDSSACSAASEMSTSSAQRSTEKKEKELNATAATAVEKAPLTPTKMKRIRRPRELLQLTTLSTLNAGEWNGDSITIYNKNSNKANNPSEFYCRPTTVGTEQIHFKASAASHELRKLKKLDLSYAEVLKQSAAARLRAQRHK
ncbi:cerebellar degeneration-related protein 2-like isoform X3 [Chironomus tepperi]|uniref:cerebellar degeneration-related protein 2-like isoform X3 n=1 Tax=Chironomus tepperi TaxID=113505 RepID=UPI00391F60B6